MRAPGPGVLATAKTMRAMRRDPTSFFEGLQRDHGDVATFAVGPYDAVLLSKPEHVHEVFVTQARRFKKGRGLSVAKRILGEGLLTSEGDFHKRQRRLVSPAFHRERVNGYGAAMVTEATRAIDTRLTPGAELDVASEMMRLTLAIVGRTLFDSDVAADAEGLGHALTTTLERFIRMTTAPWLELVEKLPLPGSRRRVAAKAKLDGTIERIIRDRRGAGDDRGDLLSMLLLAEDPEHPGESMNDEQVKDEAMTLFLAGHETTALALTWTLFLLSQHADAEDAVRKELAEVLAGRAPTAADFPRLKQTEAALAEAMRLYPPAWAIGRRAIEDHPVGRYRIRAGSFVMMSPWVMHRDARFWRDPLSFDLGRWTAEERAKRPKFAYFPFGGGPRVCIGEGFAWLEGVLVLATLLQRRSFRLAPGQEVALAPLITLRPKHGMRMRVSARA